jgi:hypothetical protein
MNCPICNCPLPPPERDEIGVERYFCNCAGFRRAVVEVAPASPNETTVEIELVKKKGTKHNDRSN